MIDATEQLISLDEAGGILRVSVPTLRRWIKAGKLEAVKPGKAYMTSTQAVNRLIGVAVAHMDPGRLRQQQRDAQIALEHLMG